MTMTMSVEMPDSFSIELRSLLTGLLQRDVHKRLGCRGRGAEEIKSHPFFRGIDWRVVFLLRLAPPLIPARGEVNAADAFDIGSFDDEDTKHIKLTEADQELYRNFPVVVSERWQHEIAETIFDYINHEADKAEMKRKNKHKLGYQEEEQSDCILHGYIKRLGGTFTATWLTRYVRLYPNRLELWSDSGKQPELIFMDQIEEVCNDYVQIKNEQCIVIKLYNHSKYVFTNSDEIGLKEWHVSLKAAHKESLDMMTTMAEKATKIYGTEIPVKHMGKRRQQLQQEANNNSAIANLEQKIIQKELHQASSSALVAPPAPPQPPPAAPPAAGPTEPGAAKAAAAAGQRTSGAGDESARPASSGSVHHKHHRGHHHQHRSHHHRHHHHHEHATAGSATGTPTSTSGHAHAHHHHHHHGHRGARQPAGEPAGAVKLGAAIQQKRQQQQQPEVAAAVAVRRSPRPENTGATAAAAAAPAAVCTKLADPNPVTATVPDRDTPASEAASTAAATVQLPRQTEAPQQIQEPEERLAEISGKSPPTAKQLDAEEEVAAAAAPAEARNSSTSIQSGTSSISSGNGGAGAAGEPRETSQAVAPDGATSSSGTCSSGSSSTTSEASDEVNEDLQHVQSVQPPAVAVAVPVPTTTTASVDHNKTATVGGSLDHQQQIISKQQPIDEIAAASVGSSLATDDAGAKHTQQQQKLEQPPRIKLAVSLENVSEQQEVLRDPSKRITSDNKQREQDLVAQYEKLNVTARVGSSSSIEEENA